MPNYNIKEHHLTSVLVCCTCAGQVLMSDELEKVAHSIFNGKVSNTFTGIQGLLGKPNDGQYLLPKLFN